MLNTLRRRYPLAEVILAPCAVQGVEAPFEIVAALQMLNRSRLPDVIIVARGGGSLEDLWAFNDERVVRAIRASQIPVIAGVGHETDFTLADFAADVRAPTPTGPPFPLRPISLT
jgi:exodeoxyribonuclease VII large subunit